ncbi:MAG: hypothetical protein AAFV53_09935, partial [Myxococcota bacterium]
HRQGRLPEAEAHYRHALRVYQEGSHLGGEGYILGKLGLLEMLSGASEAGLARVKRGETLLRDLNNLQGLAELLCSLAHAEHLAHHADAAGAALREAQQIADDLNVAPDASLARHIAEVQAILTETPS